MNIAFTAHDGRKKLLESLCIAYRNILSSHNLFSTGTTGQIIERATNLQVTKFLSGNLGGVRQLGTYISYNEIDLLVFLRDPSEYPDYEDGDEYILRLCDTQNIPAASNLATAEALLMALDRGDLDWRRWVNYI